VHPTIWKLEGYETAEGAHSVLRSVAEGTDQPAECIVLGRNAPLSRVEHWIEVAAPLPGYAGFAVGRSIWEQPLKDLIAGHLERPAAVALIAQHYRDLIETYIGAGTPESPRGRRPEDLNSQNPRLTPDREETVRKPSGRQRSAPTIEGVVSRWHSYLRGELPGGLDGLLDDEVVLYSPIVFTPQKGKQITSLYLQAATQTFAGREPTSNSGSTDGDGRFRYTKSLIGGDTAILEFETTMEGKYVNGVDIIRCNDGGRIIEFRVMIRPLQAVNLVHQQMGAMLESMTRQD
jgi:hypothetical protein